MGQKTLMVRVFRNACDEHEMRFRAHRIAAVAFLAIVQDQYCPSSVAFSLVRKLLQVKSLQQPDQSFTS